MKEDDQQQIRDLVATWHKASAAGDIETVLGLMAEDVVFLIPGQEPMRGRDAFAASFKESAIDRFRLESSFEILEIEIADDWAFMVSHLRVTMTPLEHGTPVRRAGHTLTIFRREDDKWLLARDANLLTPEKSA